MIDLAAYGARIGYTGHPRPDVATLLALHLAHATHVPFENIDIQLGLPVSLETAALEDKLVRRRRGGYCFEQNTLLLEVLRAIGFDAVPYEARVRLGVSGLRPRTHMLLRVRVDGSDWLADVGFGLQGLLQPLRMDGRECTQGGDEYRLAAEGPERVLQWRRREGWADLYAFVPEERFPIDFVMGNHFTSTYPLSPFVQNLVVQLPTTEARHGLRNHSYTVTRGGTILEERSVPDHAIPRLLRERFALDVADGTRFRALTP